MTVFQFREDMLQYVTFQVLHDVQDNSGIENNLLVL
jgi:hypothetical protein